MVSRRDYLLIASAGAPAGDAYGLALARPDAPTTRTTPCVMCPSDTHDSDKELAWARRIRAGDASAFESLFSAYYASLLRFTFGYVKARSVAEELVQDTFFHLWLQRERWEVRETVRAYLYTATRNRALNWLRRRAMEQRWTDNADDSTDVAFVPRMERADERAQMTELDAAIHAAIDQLPPRCRETFVLSRQHHLSHEQIADVMGISVKTVQEQMGRALRALRHSLAEWLE